MVSVMDKRLIPEGYKQTEVGVIPEDWFIHKLGEIGQNIIGLTYSPNDVSEFGTLVLRSSNVQDNRLAFENNVFVNMELPERVIVKEHDILICVRNGSRQLIGKCALIDKATAGVAFGAFMSIYRSEHNGLLFFQFQSDNIQYQINEVMGATINQITNKDMASFIVPLPCDRKEQTAIANALSDVDTLIAALEKLINKKSAIKTAVMQQLLTGKKRLPPFDQLNTGYKQTEFGEIPSDWELSTIGENTHWMSGGTPSRKNDAYWSGKIPWISGSTLKSAEISTSDQFLTAEAIDVGSQMAPLNSTLLLVRGSALHNEIRAGLVVAPVSFNQDVKALIPNGSVAPKYLTLYLLGMNSNLLKLVSSAGNSAGVLDTELVQNFYFFKPSKLEQITIANALSDMDKDLEAIQQRLHKTRQIKQGMMQELLTGRTRLV